MKKEDQNIILSDLGSVLDKGDKNDSFKTTDINVLLNRVRLDKKRTFKKRITISFFLVTIITTLTVYFIV